MKKLKVLALCDGISCGYMALKNIGIQFEYHAVEIEKWKRDLSDDNFPDIIRPCHDVNDFLPDENDPDKKLIELDEYDLILAGPTCTSLSSQGPRTDWDGASKVFFDCLDILRMSQFLNPNVKFLFENVHSMKLRCRDEITNSLEVDHYLGLSALVSGQDRKRYYWFNWDRPAIEDRKIMANDLLDPDGVHLFSFSKSNRNLKGAEHIVEGRLKTNGKSGTLVTGQGCRGRSTMNQVITNKMKTRDLTVDEAARLQTIPDYFTFSSVSDARAYEAIGDGWSVEMITEILKALSTTENKA